MEDLEKQLLLRELADYGYPLVLPEAHDPSDALRQMVEADDARLLEGVPVVLTNMLRSDVPLDLSKFEHSLPGRLQRRFRTFVAVTHELLLLLDRREKLRDVLKKYLDSAEPSLLQRVGATMQAHGELMVGGDLRMSTKRLEQTFRNYVVNDAMRDVESATKKLDVERQHAFEDALCVLFTDRQKELLFKVFDKRELTKTEREYYSRVVKPRLKALRNAELQAFAATLLGY